MSQYYYYANPKIHFFPRGVNDLLDEEKRTVDGVETVEKKCELKDILRTYEDSKDYAFGDKHFKNIESRMYLDLWNSYQNNEYTVTKKVCVGFLYKKGDQLCFTDKEACFYSLELVCEVCGASQLTACLKADGMGSGGEPGSSLVINMNPVENRIKELSVMVKYRDGAELPESAELKIKAKFCNAKKWKETFSLTLYRNSESSLDDFKQNPGKKDTDFFVLPRAAPSAKQKKCIRQLQILNNQVLARNASLENFTFVEESGEIIKATGTTTTKIYEAMATNSYNSLNAFKYDLKTGMGCKSGAKIGKMETQYSYNFINYGHQNGFIDYLANEYSIAPDTLKGIVYDRNFLYGNYKDGDPDNKIEGIVNLYRKVVVPFVNNFMSLLLEFHNFSHQWLSCPKYNKNYHRGPFTVGEGISKYLYKNQSVVNLANEFSDSNINGNILPEGTIVKFHPEKDNNAFAMDGTTNFYKVSSVTIPGQLEKSYTINEKVCIKLSYEDKKNCNDKDIDCILFNLGNYTSTEGLTDQRDIDAVSGYNNFGIPYFINNGNMSKIDNSKGAKLSKTVLFNWKEDEKFGTNEIKNWYSYEKKPNTEQFGIDCSGLVLNCLLEISKKK